MKPVARMMTPMVVTCRRRIGGVAMAYAMRWIMAGVLVGAGVCAGEPGTQVAGSGRSYCVVGTGQRGWYGDREALRAAPREGEAFYGQDSQHPGVAAAYRDNRDGTISDLNTGLMWVKARGAKVSWDEAMSGAGKCKVGGHGDWRTPTIKELYSLMDFRGGMGGGESSDPKAQNADFRMGKSRPYIDVRYFDFVYGDESKGERGD